MKKTMLALLLVFAILLTGCRGNAQADEPAVDPLPTATIKKVEPTNTIAPLPTVSTEWGDMSIYAAGLRPEFQNVLENTDGASEYHITLDIPAQLPAPITGSMSVHYTNQETVPLEDIYFRLFAPAYNGLLDVSDVQVNDMNAATFLESNTTALRVSLPTPLEVGESLIISMNFVLTLPETLEGSYGLLGYFGDTLTLDTFYPMIPAYDEDYGWYSHTPYPNGDLTYQDMSYYQVTVRASEDFILATSGVAIDQMTSGDSQQVTFVAGPARDFYISGSYNYTVESAEIDGITVNSYGKAGYGYSQSIALNTGLRGIEVFSEIFGEYPYTEFDIVNSPMLAYGVEYPGITNILDNLYPQANEEAGLTTLEVVIAHEVGHQWFYNMVGSDQQDHPWLDEAVTQYITYLYVLDQYGEAAAQQANIGNWEFRMGRINNEIIPIGLPANEYEGLEYSGIVYGRGPLFFLELENVYGQEIVIDALHEYFQDNIWEVGDEAELRASLEDACACDLSEMFAEWIDE